MGRYVKRPIVVEAFKWTGRPMITPYGTSLEELQSLGCPVRTTEHWGVVGHANRWSLIISTLEDGPNAQVSHYVSLGDWLVKGVNNEWYPVKPDVFDKTYDPDTSPLDNPKYIVVS